MVSLLYVLYNNMTEQIDAHELRWEWDHRIRRSLFRSSPSYQYSNQEHREGHTCTSHRISHPGLPNEAEYQRQAHRCNLEECAGGVCKPPYHQSSDMSLDLRRDHSVVFEEK